MSLNTEHKLRGSWKSTFGIYSWDDIASLIKKEITELYSKTFLVCWQHNFKQEDVKRKLCCHCCCWRLLSTSWNIDFEWSWKSHAASRWSFRWKSAECWCCLWTWFFRKHLWWRRCRWSVDNRMSESCADLSWPRKWFYSLLHRIQWTFRHYNSAWNRLNRKNLSHFLFGNRCRISNNIDPWKSCQSERNLGFSGWLQILHKPEIIRNWQESLCFWYFRSFPSN